MSFTVHCYKYYLIHVVLLYLGVFVAADTATNNRSQDNAVFKENDIAAIPTFMIIGVAKGGTTDLYYQLTTATVNLDSNRHEPPLLSQTKEIRMLHMPIKPEELLFGSETMLEYLKLIHHPCAPETKLPPMRSCIASQPQQYTIDASPMYLSSPFTPLNLRPVSLTTKILIMLRDPLETLESLYIHRVIKGGKWTHKTLNTLAEEFFEFLTEDKALQKTFAALTACGDTACQEQGWRDLTALGLSVDDRFSFLFMNSLYVYSLAAWRRHCFQPGRVMVIDSHAYYRDRVAVMEQVIRFLYGREMNSAERSEALSASPQNTHELSAMAHPDRHLLNQTMSPITREKIGVFFHEHVRQQLLQTLVEMKEEGAWVVGFDSSPWPWAPDRTK